MPGCAPGVVSARGTFCRHVGRAACLDDRTGVGRVNNRADIKQVAHATHDPHRRIFAVLPVIGVDRERETRLVHGTAADRFIDRLAKLVVWQINRKRERNRLVCRKLQLPFGRATQTVILVVIEDGFYVRAALEYAVAGLNVVEVPYQPEPGSTEGGRLRLGTT